MKKIKTLAVSLITIAALMLAGCNSNPNIIKPPDIPDYGERMSIGDYKNISYTLQNDYTLTDDMLNAELESICILKTSSHPVDGKTVETGDNIILTYSGTIDNHLFQNSSTDSVGTYVKIGTTAEPVSWFENEIIGMKKGDSKKITVNIPDTYSDKSVAGKTAEFSVAVVDIRIFKSAITDAMVSECSGGTYKTKDDVKFAIINDLKSLHDFEIYNAAMAEIIKNSTFASYESDVIDRLVTSSMNTLNSMAATLNMTVPEFLKEYGGEFSTEESYKAQMTKQAQNYLQVQMAVCEIARRENITATPEEFTEYKTKFAKENGYSDIRMVNLEYTDTDLLVTYITPKVRDWLVNHTDVPNRYTFEERPIEKDGEG